MNTNISEHEEGSLLRNTFLSVLKIFFIVMCYFYISEIYGAISTPYISEEPYNVIFGGALLLFTFFSILAGKYLSLISGFLGEFTFQFVFYENIYWDWVIYVAVYGFICGFYQYKPLKYREGMKLYYTFLLLIITSFIFMIAITLSQVIWYENPLGFEYIFINYGFKFLTQCLISTIFLICSSPPLKIRKTMLTAI